MGRAEARPIRALKRHPGFPGFSGPHRSAHAGCLRDIRKPARGLPHALFCKVQRCYICRMTTEDIEKAVEHLAPRDLARFRAWFEAFDAVQFDLAIERDVGAGKLDAHADEALAAHRAGRSRDL